MTAQPLHQRYRVSCLLGVTIFFFLPACRFDPSGLAPAGFRIACDIDVWDCPKTATPPNFTLGGASPSINSYIKRPDFWKVKDTPYQVYWNRPIFVIDPGPNELRGATMVMTGATDWNNNDAAFLSVTLNEDVAGVYVAYDSRATPKPAWLLDSSRYQKLSGSLVVTIPDQTKSPPEPLKLNVYLARNVTANGAALTLPGNSAGGAGWQQIANGDPAMYVVFVAPQVRPDCTQGKFKKPYHLDDCYTFNSDEESLAMAAAKSAANAGCRSANPQDVCQAPTCTSEAWEPSCELVDSITGCMFCRTIDAGFEHNSEVAFLASTSSASGTVADSAFNSTVEGQLLFEYRTNALGAMDVMVVNRMVLEVASFGTEVGNFTDIRVALQAQTAAKCQDSPAPVGLPCHWYQIPTEEFWCAESCRLDGDPVAFSSNSDAPIDIYLDPVTHQFSITGSLQSTAEVHDEQFDIDVTLDLVGEVVNYAPSAAAGFEGDDTAECSDGANESAIYLDAGQSFDVDDGALPTGSFEWYEDYGLVTETFWGTGQTIAIGAGQLGFGEHHITLVVTDSQGVLDTDTIVATVADTAPPLLEVPDDVEVYTAVPPPVHVSIGEALAADRCLPLPEGAISNDAPADSRFDATLTLVTWRADDGRGNEATDVQRVTVYSVTGLGSLLDAIRNGILHLEEAVDRRREDIAGCEPAAECPVDLGSLVESIDEQIGLANDAAQQDDRGPDPYVALNEHLAQARSHVLNAAGLLEESNAAVGTDSAPMLRGQADESLAASRAMLEESARDVDAVQEGIADDGTDEPADGDQTDGGEDGDSVQPRGFCGFGAGLVILCIPVFAIWKACRRFL